MRRDAHQLLEVLFDAADAARDALLAVSDWRLSGARDGQYRADVLVDGAVLAVLRAAGLGILSEESGLDPREGAPLVIVDPLDGSTNASRGIGWFATAMGVIDDEGLLCAVVANQSSGVRYHAVRGQGAFRDGAPVVTESRCERLDQAVIGVNGWPARHLGWAQYRCLGAAALDLCLIADGVLDGYVDCTRDSHGVWDYAAATLICQEAGAVITDVDGRDLVVGDHAMRRTPIAATNTALHEQLLAARQALDFGPEVHR